MKLSTGIAVLNKMGLSSVIVENVTSAELALDFASTSLAAVLDTSLEAADRKDYFSYLPGKYAPAFSSMQLIAEQGFWTSKPKVYFSIDGAPVVPSAAALVGSTSYVHDATKGTITLLVEPTYVGPNTILVTYSAGFEDGSSEIPQWLSDAGMSYAILNMHAHVKSYNRKDTPDKTDHMQQTAYATVSPHIRPRPLNSHYPTVSVVA